MAKRDKKGMDPTVAALSVGTVFVIIALLMIVRGGHDDARPPGEVKGVERTN